jgi:hypothetical protein
LHLVCDNNATNKHPTVKTWTGLPSQSGRGTSARPGPPRHMWCCGSSNRCGPGQLIATRELLAGTARPRPRYPRRLARTRAARAPRAGVGSAAAARRRGRRTGASASASSTGRIRRRVTVLGTHRVRRRARCGWVAGSVGRGRAWVSRHSHRRPHHHTGGEP